MTLYNTLWIGLEVCVYAHDNGAVLANKDQNRPGFPMACGAYDSLTDTDGKPGPRLACIWEYPSLTKGLSALRNYSARCASSCSIHLCTIK